MLPLASTSRLSYYLEPDGPTREEIAVIEEEKGARLLILIFISSIMKLQNRGQRTILDSAEKPYECFD